MSLYVCKCRCVMDEEKGIYRAVIRTKVYIGGSGIKLPVPWYIEYSYTFYFRKVRGIFERASMHVNGAAIMSSM